MPIARRVLPHIGADEDGTYDSRYYTEAEVDALLALISADTHDHDVDYYTKAEMDAALALKAAATHDHDDRYFTEAEVTAALALKSALSHTHDDRYFTESEVTASLAGKASTAHTHTWASLTDKPATFTAAAGASTNSYYGVGTNVVLASASLGPLVSGQKYLITALGELSFDGTDGAGGADVMLRVGIAGTAYQNPDVSRAEQGVDVGYTVYKNLIYTGSGSTVTIDIGIHVTNLGINTRYHRISGVAIPVGNP